MECTALRVAATAGLWLCVALPGLSQGVNRSDLVIGDLRYSRSQNVLYAAVKSISPHAPNTILVLDPVTGQDISQIPAGNNPMMLALSSDERYLYVWLEGDNQIKRFNLSTTASDMQFPAALIGEPAYPAVASMLVVQNDPAALVVFFKSTCCTPSDGGAAVFQNGQQLSKTIAPASIGCTSATYGATPTTLWCQDSLDTFFSVSQLQLGPLGIQVAEGPAHFRGTEFNQTPIFFENRLYFNAFGEVADLVNQIVLAQPSFVGDSVGDFALDSDAGIIYYSRADAFEEHVWIVGMDVEKFTQVAFGSVKNLLSRMVRCGAGGLAGINESHGLSIFPLSMVPRLLPAQPGPPTTDSSGITRLALPNGCYYYCPNQLIYDPGSNRLFAAIPDEVSNGNSIVSIDATTLTPQSPLWVGSQPATLALTPDEQHLLVGFYGFSDIRRINLGPFQPDADTVMISPTAIHGYPFPFFANSIVPISPSGDIFAVSRGGGNPFEPDVRDIAQYSQGTLTGSADAKGALSIVPSSDAGALYGLVFAGPTGGQGVATIPLPIQGFNAGNATAFPGYLTCRNTTCLSSGGALINAATNRVLGICPVFGSPVLDLANQRAYFLTGTAQFGEIIGCDLTRFIPTEVSKFPDGASSLDGLVMTDPETFALNNGAEILKVPKSTLKPLPPMPVPSPVSGAGQVSLSLTSNQGVYDPLRDRLYVMLSYPPLPSYDQPASTSFGDSVGVINPETGALISQIPLPGQPMMAAISSDSSYLYVALQYSDTVVQVNLSSGTVSQSIVVGSAISALTAVPGMPSSIAVADATTLHIFDNGVERSGSYTAAGGLGITALVFGTDSSQLLSAGSKLSSWHVTAAGITLQRSISVVSGIQRLSVIGDSIYTDTGLIFSVGSLTQLDSVSAAYLIGDPVSNRIFGYVESPGDVPVGLSAFDASRETLVASWSNGERGWIIPCGSQRVAVLGSNHIVIYSVASGLLPALPTSYAPDPSGVTRLPVSATSLAWDSTANRIVMTLSAGAGPSGNSLVSLDPFSGKLYPIATAGNRPGAVSVAPDQHVAYVGQIGPRLVERISLDSGANQGTWILPAVGTLTDPVPSQLFAISAATDTLAALAEPASLVGFPALLVMDNGVVRREVAGLFPNILNSSVLAASADRQQFYTQGSPVAAWTVAPTGVERTTVPAISGLRAWSKAAACGGNLYLNSGQVMNPSTGQIVGDFGGPPSFAQFTAVACDSTTDLLLYLSTSNGGFDLTAYRLSSGTSLGFVRFGNIQGNPVDMLVAGPSFAAIRTDQGTVVVLALSSLSSALPTPSISGVANAASYSQGGFAPGSIISIVGTGLANWTAVAGSYPVPTSLGEASVRIGTGKAYLLYASETQINAIISYLTPTGNTTLTVTVPGGSTTVPISIVPIAPGIFTSDGVHAQAENQDYSLNSSINSAPVGSTVTIYFTGQGPVKTPPLPDNYPVLSSNPLNYVTLNQTTCTIGGKSAAVTYAGLAPGLVGVAQANVVIPQLASGSYPLVLSVGGTSSNTGLISVR